MTRVPPGEDLDLEALAEAEPLEYRGRGRPKLPADQRRRAKLIISLTGDEMTTMIVAAAGCKDEKNRPLRVQEWARRVLLANAATAGMMRTPATEMADVTSKTEDTRSFREWREAQKKKVTP